MTMEQNLRTLIGATVVVVVAVVMVQWWKTTTTTETTTETTTTETGRERVVRAAIDVGSGEHKLVVASVVLTEEGGSKEKIDQVVYSESVGVALGLDMQRENGDGSLSTGILMYSYETLHRFRDLARALGAEETAAVATAVFRRASNGAAYVEQIAKDLGVELEIVDQEVEGRLGYLTALAAVGRTLPDVETVIAWDSGGGSFQIADQDQVYAGPIGNADAFAMLRDAASSRGAANPVDREDAMRLVDSIRDRLPPVPDWLDVALCDTPVICFGHVTSLFRLAADLIGKPDVNDAEVGLALAMVTIDETQSDLMEKMRELALRHSSRVQPHDAFTDAPYPEIDLLVPKLALLLAVMRHLDIKSFHYEYANGSCLGMLLYKPFWHISPSLASSGGGGVPLLSIS